MQINKYLHSMHDLLLRLETLIYLRETFIYIFL
jgi:hypothetical protein